MATLHWRLFSNRMARAGARLAIVSLAAVSCTVPAARAADKPVIIGRDMDLNSLDPARAFCDTCQIYLSSVYARIVDLDKDNKTIIPYLAKSWESNSGPEPVHVQARSGGEVFRRRACRGKGRQVVPGAPEEHQGQRGLYDGFAEIHRHSGPADRGRQSERTQLRISWRPDGALHRNPELETCDRAWRRMRARTQEPRIRPSNGFWRIPQARGRSCCRPTARAMNCGWSAATQRPSGA